MIHYDTFNAFQKMQQKHTQICTQTQTENQSAWAKISLCDNKMRSGGVNAAN